MTNEIDCELYDKIKILCEHGNKLADEDNHKGAIDYYLQAYELIPEPKENWEASTWILTSIGESFLFLEEFEQAKNYLLDAMHCPKAIGNPLIHLRLGQVQFNLNNLGKAADELTRAYMGGGKEMFECEDKKYFEFIKNHLKNIE